jgi:hypothetical protein
MDFRWRYLDLAGHDVSGPDERFADQSEAEEWLSSGWQDLFDAGVHQVTLLHGEAEVYGPMSLHPA